MELGLEVKKKILEYEYFWNYEELRYYTSCYKTQGESKVENA